MEEGDDSLVQNPMFEGDTKLQNYRGHLDIILVFQDQRGLVRCRGRPLWYTCGERVTDILKCCSILGTKQQDA